MSEAATFLNMKVQNAFAFKVKAAGRLLFQSGDLSEIREQDAEVFQIRGFRVGHKGKSRPSAVVVHSECPEDGSCDFWRTVSTETYGKMEI